MKYIGYVVTYLVLAVLSVTYSGCALSVLWDWFIVSTFNVDSISIPAAIGLALIVGYLTKTEEPQDEDKSFSEKMKEAAFKAALKPTFALLIGWLVTLFM